MPDHPLSRSSYIEYADLGVGDHIEVYVLDMTLGWRWEPREVVAVDRSGSEHGDLALTVRFRDPSDDREYDIDALKAREQERRIRRREPFGYCLCGSPNTLYCYPRVGPAPGNMKVCTRDECDRSLAAIKRGIAQQVKQWDEEGLIDG